jgi:DNA modification methylase
LVKEKKEMRKQSKEKEQDQVQLLGQCERKQKVNIRTGKEYEQGTIPTCVWEKNNHTTSKEYCNWHPTQKPISILERFIEAYTNPGETVLDIFNGAGSTMIACENTGRIFKGCEIDPDYYEQSIARFTTLTGKQYNNNLIKLPGNQT